MWIWTPSHYTSCDTTHSYKKTVLYNPANSETYKALQEDSLGDVIQEVPVPVQMKVFHAPTARTGPIKVKNIFILSNNICVCTNTRRAIILKKLNSEKMWLAFLRWVSNPSCLLRYSLRYIYPLVYLQLFDSSPKWQY